MTCHDIDDQIVYKCSQQNHTQVEMSCWNLSQAQFTYTWISAALQVSVSKPSSTCILNFGHEWSFLTNNQDNISIRECRLIVPRMYVQ